MRSWVIGRGVSMFCIDRAIACASGVPMKIGSTPPLPRRLAEDDHRCARRAFRSFDADQFHLDGHRRPHYSRYRPHFRGR